jgi:hypothetical protein
MYRRQVLRLLTLSLLTYAIESFTARKPLCIPSIGSSRVFGGAGKDFKISPKSSLTMRDHSASYWFQVGQSVRVVDDVTKAGSNLRNRIGKVVETWEKCNVDPTCCCAEQVDTDMAVRVEFQGNEQEESGDGSFYHYFAEDELKKVEEPTIIVAADSQVAFDGMSCKAFKLERLQMGQQAKRLAAFEASREAEE